MKHIILFFLFLPAGALALAQTPKKGKTKQVPVQKFNTPKVFTRLGSHSDSEVVNVAEALRVISMPLKITDEKNNIYPLVNYQFLYHKQGVTEDEQTGKVTPATSMVSDVFTATPLPGIWLNNITDQLKPGEELYFFDVVTKNEQGHLFFAPNLKLIIRQ